MQWIGVFGILSFKQTDLKGIIIRVDLDSLRKLSAGCLVLIANVMENGKIFYLFISYEMNVYFPCQK